MKLTKLLRLHIVLDDRIGSEERQRPVRAHLMKEAIREAIASERGHRKAIRAANITAHLGHVNDPEPFT